MKYKDYVNILIKFFLQILFENVKKLKLKNPFFEVGVKFDPPLVLKGLRYKILLLMKIENLLHD